MNKLGLYLHIPFCKRKCEYCDFYSVTDLSLIPVYVDRLCQDLADKSRDCTGFCVDTVYLGGGTPSLLSCEEVERILSVIRKHYNLSENPEITIEINPSSLTKEKAQKYAEIGLTRASIGMQSACDTELSKLGRLHDRSGFDSAFGLLRDAGIGNISVDLMYGIPGQSIDTLSESIKYVCSKAPEHVSAYCLKVEEGTPFCKLGVEEADEDTAFNQYEYISNMLKEYGYHRYEVSNFAKDGLHSRHNVKYWLGEEYLGFGPGAYSFFNGVRYGFDRSLSDYITGSARTVDVENISKEEREREKIIFGLRLCEGVDTALLDNNTLSRFISLGLMESDGSKARLTTAGFFVSNTIISEFID